MGKVTRQAPVASKDHMGISILPDMASRPYLDPQWTSSKGLMVLLDGIWGVLQGSWGVLVDRAVLFLSY